MSLLFHVKQFRKNVGRYNPDHGEPIFVHFVYINCWGSWRVDLHLEWVGGQETRIHTRAKTPRGALIEACKAIDLIKPNRRLRAESLGEWVNYREENK